MKNIIVFTVTYPYGSKEQFLETEIEYLSQSFENIIVIPTYVTDKARDTPENVSIDIGFAQQNSNALFFINSLLSKYFYKELLDNPFIVLSLSRLSKLSSFVGKGKSLYKYLKNHYTAKNVFYTYWFNGSTFGCYLYDTCVQNISYCTRVHRHDLYLEVNEDYLPLRPLILEKITNVFPISQQGKDYLLNHYSIDKNKLSVSRLGTKDYNIITKMSESKDSFSLLSCSHISPVKRIDTLMKALSQVAKKNSELKISWAHIGTGKEQKRLEGLAYELACENLEMTFLGEMNNKDIFEYYKTSAIDLFVNVSSSEGLPVTFMEAFSCAIPIFTLDNGGISEIVNNENGVLLKQDSSFEEIVSGLNDCIQNKDVLALKKHAARSTWEKSYNANKNYIDFCKDLNENN